MKIRAYSKLNVFKILISSLIGLSLEIILEKLPPAQAIALIAAGDTTQTSTVLWARSQSLGNINFEYSTDPNFKTILGTVSRTITDPLLPVKVSLINLNPGSDYFYRVIDASGAATSGQLSTAASLGTYAGLRFGVSGDWRGELAPYPAIANAAERDLNFFVELGDTIYADYPSPDLPQPQAKTLNEFRQKHNEVYSERYGLNTWGDLRASTSILATIDDHEVTNDFAGGALADSDPRFETTNGLINDTQLYENGLQAFQEYNPLRDEFYRTTGDPRTEGEGKLYRYNTYGSDAATFLLDTRSFRDVGLTPVTNPSDPSQVGAFLVNSFNPTRTLLGEQQLTDLKQDLLAAQQKGITWKFVMVPEPIQNLGVVGASDRFEGYGAERANLLDFIAQNDIKNVVFVTADIHGTLVNNLTYQLAPFATQIPTGAFEISTGSVAFDAPFGPTVIEIASAAGLITPEQRAFYDSLSRAGKDAFIKNLIDAQLTPFGYDLMGLEGSTIDATLLQGSYLSTHTYGWTEFNIDPQTQQLLVTTYGIDPYTEVQLNANPQSIAGRTPTIVSQFAVNPQGRIATSVPEPSIGLLTVGVLGMSFFWRQGKRSKGKRSL
jgi:phosphodiesterase/alkaline phosphatase D-like protein